MHRDNDAGWRAAALAALGREQFDLLVVGGGINGAGIARDATLRGLKVAVVEQGDFASGTSSRSSKLIHGGLRYLEQGNVKLVRESTRERELLRRLAPHLVRPMRFVYPLYRGSRMRPWMLNVGLWGYDLLAGIRSVKRHRMLSPAAVHAIEPALRTEGLRGAGEYWDCWTNDARLVVETMLSAAQAGAVAVSYVRLAGFVKESGRIVGATLVDRVGGTRIDCRARVVVNATGPWAGKVSELDGPGGVRLRLTKGVHVILPRARVGNEAALVLHARRDRRVMFVIPWGAHALVGTTDTDHPGGPDEPPRVEADDVAYLLETVNHYFPAAHLGPADVVGAYAGLRPLIAPPETASLSPSAVSREEEIHTAASGLISMAGGKLTTFRLVSEQIVDQVVAMLRVNGDERRFEPCRTAETPLPGGQVDPSILANRTIAQNGHGVSAPVVAHLAARYGERLGDVLAHVARDQSLGAPVLPGEPDARAEIAHAVEHEFAMTLEDVLVRRTQLGLVDAEGSAEARLGRRDRGARGRGLRRPRGPGPQAVGLNAARETKPARTKRARAIARALARAYPDAWCALDYRTPWELLVATILSAQCTDKMVNQVTPALFREFPTPAALAAAPAARVEGLIHRTGFFRQKTRSLQAAARAVADSLGEEVPSEMDVLTKLPGVGRKTANVVRGTAFGLPAIFVDTHVGRLANRLALTLSDDPVRIESDLGGLLPRPQWTAFAHRLIHHGRRVCAARKPRCSACPIARWCPRVGVTAAA